MANQRRAKWALRSLLGGMLEPQAGDMAAARDLKVGYFAQHQVEQLHPEHSALEHLAQIDPAAREGAMRTWLGGFGFSGDTVFMPTKPFSGGEKSRLALALLVYQRPNLLLLDEPTNHLDLEMRQALAVALQEFDGAMVIVSHDRHLLRVSTDTLLLVHGGGVAEFDGSLDDYPAWLSAQSRGRRVTAASGGDGSAAGRKARKQLEAEKRRLLAPLGGVWRRCSRNGSVRRSRRRLDSLAQSALSRRRTVRAGRIAGGQVAQCRAPCGRRVALAGRGHAKKLNRQGTNERYDARRAAGCVWLQRVSRRPAGRH
ncbi:MAG: ATP-binding cassette domain-containing protein [Woeseiaceae bacterium]|nr:ATP-binding cassette domain-containing protein [Woeseiaceae bacterium]